MATLDADATLRHALRRSSGLLLVVEAGEVSEASAGMRELIGGEPEARDELIKMIGSALDMTGTGHARIEHSVVDPKGLVRLLALDATSLPEIAAPSFVAVGHDLTSHYTRDAELTRRATTDALTGLPNRSLLEDRIGRAVLTAERQRSSVALMLIDLDRFKNINDTFGHVVGDGVLRDVAKRMRRELRDSDTLGRLGGDEFVVLLPAPADLVSALATGGKLLAALEEPVAIGETMARTSATIGIALFPTHARTPATLIDRADAAMYAARRAGASIAGYDAVNDTRTAAALTQLQDLAVAIGRGDLQLAFQPTLRLSDMRAIRAEALVRWTQHGTARMPPAAFVNLAERAGLGRALTGWVLARALARCSRWQEEGFTAGVSINLGLTDLLDPDLPKKILQELDTASVAPRVLSLDISERSVQGDPAQLERRLRALAQTGVRLALDDFGSGPASLRLLQRFPFSEVKLDGQFVADICTNIDSWSFVRSGIDAAHDLGLEVTAEGVADRATAYVLERLGCDVAQGQFFTKSDSTNFAFLSATELDTPVLN